MRVPPGLEAYAAAELRAVGLKVEEEPGGVGVPLDGLQKALLHSRIASGATVTLGSVDRNQLPDALRGMPWALYVNPGQKVEIVLRGVRTRGLDKKCAAVIARHAAKRRTRGGHLPDVRVWLIAQEGNDKVDVAVEAARDLYKRGWRTNPGRAPLRENLAAGVLAALGWQADEPLVDPMCGSGTIAIEAAWLGLNRPPGAHRGFEAEGWPIFDPKTFLAMKKNVKAGGTVSIHASDRDGQQLQAAKGNAARAHVDRHVRFAQLDFADLQPPAASGLVVCNPPYGDRIAASESTYRFIGGTLEKHWSGWRYGILLPDVRLSRCLPGPVDTSLCIPHGGKKVWLAKGRVA